jgi:hypothetical protein
MTQGCPVRFSGRVSHPDREPAPSRHNRAQDHRYARFSLPIYFIVSLASDWLCLGAGKSLACLAVMKKLCMGLNDSLQLYCACPLRIAGPLYRAAWAENKNIGNDEGVLLHVSVAAS